MDLRLTQRQFQFLLSTFEQMALMGEWEESFHEIFAKLLALELVAKHEEAEQLNLPLDI